jgi:fumarate hydratase, class II
LNERIERDTLGEVRVPANKYWGAQTQRSLENFRIGTEVMPLEVVYAYALIKKAAAEVNFASGLLSEKKKNAIVAVCDQINSGQLDVHFPLRVWQTGSGTQTNMNVNEVIAYLANEKLRAEGHSEVVHPNDDVNKSQSSNDTFPTAMHIAIFRQLHEQFIPVANSLMETLKNKEQQFAHLVKIGRTHLQDATPLTLGQEISGWRYMIEKSKEMVEQAAEQLLSLAIGGTAVGTGLNTPPQFGQKVAEKLAEYTGYSFCSSPNKFHSLTSHDEIVYVHGALKALAADMMKIANDIRWLASGPRCGIGELQIPSNEPGSSIMPGKVNPTQSEAITMVAVQVFGNDATIGFAASQGNFELNVFKPVIVYNALQSIRLLADGIRSFHEKCLKGLEANEEMIQKNVNRSLMLVTALNPYIGYENAAKIAKFAYENGITLKEAALQLGLVTEEQFDQWVNPATMIGNNKNE